MNNIEPQKSISGANETIIVLLAFLGSTNVFLLGVYLFLVLSVYIFFTSNEVRVPSQIFPILTFSVLYLLFGLMNQYISFASSAKILICTIVWLAGYMLAKSGGLRIIIKMILAACFGMAAHGMVNFAYNVVIGTNFYSGKSYDFWSKSLSTSTGQAINFSLLAAIFMWALFMQRNKVLKLSISAIYIAAFVYNILIGGRSFVILTILGIIVPTVIYSFLGKKGIFIKKIIPMLFAISVVAIILWALYENNAFGMQDTFESSYFYRRFFSDISQQEITEDSRLDRKLLYLGYMFDYPFGGNHLRNELGIGHAHDLWLDVFDDAGIFAFVALWIYTISAGVRAYGFATNKKTDPEMRVLVVSIYLILFIQFFVEPILQGAPMLFYTFLMIDGMIAACLIRSYE